MNTKSEQQNDVLPTTVGMATTIFSVQGMSCAGCVATVERVLSTQSGVSNASVDFAAKTAQVEYNPTKVSADDMQRAVAQAGYTLLAGVQTVQQDTEQQMQGYCEVLNNTEL